MKLLNKLKSFAVLVFFLSFLSSATLTSCGKQQADENEDTEQPAAEEEKSEHPAEAPEHPKEESDSTKTEQQ